MTQLNKQYTRITSHQKPSCLDKIYTNIPNKMTNIMTKDNIHSDHKYVTAIYHSKHQLYTPKFIEIRNKDKLTKHNIELLIDQSPYLDEIFTTNDTDFIAQTIQIELNTIYNTLVPSRIVQYKTNYIPYYTPEIKQNIEDGNKLLT